MVKKKREIKSGELSDSLIYSARLYRSHMTRSLLVLGLHTGQDTLLKCLNGNNGQTMGELAKRLAVRPPTITKMVTRMSAQNLVQRMVSRDDSRISHVFITKQGTSLLKKIKNARKQAENSAFSKLQIDDKHKLNQLLKKVSRNLEKQENTKK